VTARGVTHRNRADSGTPRAHTSPECCTNSTPCVRTATLRRPQLGHGGDAVPARPQLCGGGGAVPALARVGHRAPISVVVVALGGRRARRGRGGRRARGVEHGPDVTRLRWWRCGPGGSKRSRPWVFELPAGVPGSGAVAIRVAVAVIVVLEVARWLEPLGGATSPSTHCSPCAVACPRSPKARP